MNAGWRAGSAAELRCGVPRFRSPATFEITMRFTFLILFRSRKEQSGTALQLNQSPTQILDHVDTPESGRHSCTITQMSI